MNDYYQLLGVSRAATPSVVKIAYEGKLKALERAGLSEPDRALERKELEKAFVTLGNPSKKAWYDERLDQHEAAATRGSSRPLVVGALLAVMAVLGATWFLVDRAHERERQRLEQERLALEREKAQKAAELEQSRLQQGQQVIDLVRDSADSARAARERAYADGLRRVEAYDAQRREAEARAASARAERERQVKESRDRMQAENDRRRALAEVERQKRFVQQREYEDERARADRYARAQSEKRQRELQEALAKRQVQ